MCVCVRLSSRAARFSMVLESRSKTIDIPDEDRRACPALALSPSLASQISAASPASVPG